MWSEVLQGTAISVGSAVILAVLTWTGLRFSESGKFFWKNLGTFALTEPKPLDPATRTLQVGGVRTVFILTVLALALAIGAVIALLFSSHAITVTLKNIGKAGAVSEVSDPSDYGPTKTFEPVDGSYNAHICTISLVSILGSEAGSATDCELRKSPTENKQWEIRVTKGLRCRVTCFWLELSK
jgi:hypothetical protein